MCPADILSDGYEPILVVRQKSLRPFYWRREEEKAKQRGQTQRIAAPPAPLLRAESLSCKGEAHSLTLPKQSALCKLFCGPNIAVHPAHNSPSPMGWLFVAANSNEPTLQTLRHPAEMNYHSHIASVYQQIATWTFKFEKELRKVATTEVGRFSSFRRLCQVSSNVRNTACSRPNRQKLPV